MKLTTLSIIDNGKSITLSIKLPVQNDGKVIPDKTIINRALRALGIGHDAAYRVA